MQGSIEEDIKLGTFHMLRTEVRGDYHITIHHDHEVWQINYTDGTLGPECYVDGESTSLPNCSVCLRKWSPQERGLRYDQQGQMTCPDCREIAAWEHGAVTFEQMSESAQAHLASSFVGEEE